MKIEIKIFILLSAIALIAFVVGKYNSFTPLGLAGLMILAAGVAHFFAQMITQPLQELTERANWLSQHQDLDSPRWSHSQDFATIAQHRPDEIGELVSAFQQMEIELERSIDRFKQTTSAKERMERELQIGREIQMNMLTIGSSAFPKHKDLEIYATLKPAYEVGGDFYDFYFWREHLSYLFEENRFCFCVGDVSGKGVPAALFMAVIKTLIKSQAFIDLSPANILTHVNEVISADNPVCMFVTLFFGVLNLSDGELIYTNAGHNPPYIRRQDGSLEPLDQGHGPALGILEGLVYQECKTTLGTGDILITYTDGVTEAMDSERHLFSDERLIKLLKSGQYNSAREAINLTTEAVRMFQGEAEQADDLTMLALQFLGQPTSRGKPSDLSISDEALSSLREQWK
ncbi:SpoIIE family protein phosphatase [Kovacikia minuta CCNUW1]|uniref:PP2C family protein-serine/threonine phosphatase n=1 Tax=Kovacikia minuta TaxID=2931930 RepID=UPI001CCF2579|nr:SpoIIE family protein phosphatase [Kovacikia minuta]UBF24577.1 SpoIIE family protein phosphatase [Kovacikia minuta CCNUW1]